MKGPFFESVKGVAPFTAVTPVNGPLPPEQAALLACSDSSNGITLVFDAGGWQCADHASLWYSQGTTGLKGVAV